MTQIYEHMDKLPEHLKTAMLYEKSGLNLLHGELKNLMLECEESLSNLSESQEVPDYRYYEGMSVAYDRIYQLTYLLSFEGAL